MVNHVNFTAMNNKLNVRSSLDDIWYGYSSMSVDVVGHDFLCDSGLCLCAERLVGQNENICGLKRLLSLLSSCLNFPNVLGTWQRRSGTHYSTEIAYAYCGQDATLSSCITIVNVFLNCKPRFKPKIICRNYINRQKSTKTFWNIPECFEKIRPIILLENGLCR